MRRTGGIILSFLFDLRNYVALLKGGWIRVQQPQTSNMSRDNIPSYRMFPLPKIPSPHLLTWQMSNEQLSWPLRSCPWPLHQHTSHPQTHTQWFPSYAPLGTLCSAVIIWLRASLPILTPKTPSSIKTKVACLFLLRPYLPALHTKQISNKCFYFSPWLNERAGHV